MSDGPKRSTETLISGKSFLEFTPSEFQAHVNAMYGSRKRSTKPDVPAPGISLSRLKSGKLSIRRAGKTRPIAYVTRAEIQALATGLDVTIAELWALFREKDYMITETRMEAERRYSEMKGIPW